MRIKPTVKEHGSGRIIQGLTATIAAPHPVLDSWVKIKLDPTPVVQYLDWSIAIERLELL